ncbi:MAG: bifunctional diaminohydroxyphosphoribosylaminopyrimidine deaminase/5-amino-6-(5-phosphoribosylamino)uracil reductase RibD [Myxococcales bacterium]|jgi:diaminohydroxyphosphoribosylaminopyrimidine deaminase/5-amino-6-(5-phosphoribosylamino)uracil reductase|nr:bifunctional diaminohydroxyphosphoribosylaminopyrimidine deaminase/5-amino-6-(5-phosphoribosylamino)uracil reductase RibD [Myxococcales bacterium]
MSELDAKLMAKALEVGRAGQPSPNPHVGALVAKDGKVVSTGHHDRAGGDHAEVVALKAAGAEAEGATLYVTLEPCNHVGRTPPCTDAILKAKIARVVIGCADPNPHVAGGGVKKLRDAGVEVVVGVEEAAAQSLIRAWTKFVTVGAPYVSLKLALSLDGRIATRTGASKWVTGENARAKVHALRSGHDAVAVGIGTALADDPRLTVRDVTGISPLRVVFDTRLRLPLESRLVATASKIPVLVLCGEDAPKSQEDALGAFGVQVLRVDRSAEGRIDVASALVALAERGVVRLMVEGGAELAGSFLATRYADELHAFLAPILLGPRGRPGAVDWAGPDSPQEAPRILEPTWELVGEDAYVHGRIHYRDQ